MAEILEISAVVLGLIYLILLIQEKIACWFFGIAGSLLSIYLFYSIQLYSESILYIYYVIIGIYGYNLWNKAKGQELAVTTITVKNHLQIIIIGVVAAIILGYIFENYTDAKNPYLDATTTTFSFIASWLEAKKILSAWIFWLFINAATVVLYVQQDLDYYLFLTLIYFVFSAYGYLKWRKSFLLSKSLTE